MKMGTIHSPWHYDVGAFISSFSDNLAVSGVRGDLFAVIYLRWHYRRCYGGWQYW
jgi:hypothetical protein